MVESAVLGVFCAELMVCVFTGVPIVAALVAGLALFIGYGLWRGCRLRELACMCARGVASARGVLESFVLIGALTALWRACGTVSEVVVLAAPLVRPAVAPLAVFCMCSLMSFLIGTSSGTATTMGVSIALAALVCAAARRMSAGQIASVCVLGFTPADPTVAELMSGGGVVSMVNVSLVVCLSSSFSGLFDGTGLLDGVRGLVEVARVAPVIVVRVDAHHGIEEPRAKRQPAGGVGLHGMDRRHGDSERIEERAVLGRVTPQVDGVHVEAVLAGKKRARNPGSTA